MEKNNSKKNNELKLEFKLDDELVLLTSKQVAEMLLITEQALREKRAKGQSEIPFLRLQGGDIRYRLSAVKQYLQSIEIDPKKQKAS